MLINLHGRSMLSEERKGKALKRKLSRYSTVFQIIQVHMYKASCIENVQNTGLSYKDNQNKYQCHIPTFDSFSCLIWIIAKRMDRFLHQTC